MSWNQGAITVPINKMPTTQTTSTIAWTGLTAAILVPTGVLALLPAALLLAALTTGFNGVQINLGISTGLSALLEGVVVITAAFAMRSTAGRWLQSRSRLGAQDTGSEAADVGNAAGTSL